jgi:hypothetical protein
MTWASRRRRSSHTSHRLFSTKCRGPSSDVASARSGVSDRSLSSRASDLGRHRIVVGCGNCRSRQLPTISHSTRHGSVVRTFAATARLRCRGRAPGLATWRRMSAPNLLDIACFMLSAVMLWSTSRSGHCGQTRTAVLDHRARLFHNTMSSEWVLMLLFVLHHRPHALGLPGPHRPARSRRRTNATGGRGLAAWSHLWSRARGRPVGGGATRCGAVRRGSLGYRRPWR